MAQQRKRLLIIDDTEIDRMILKSFLVGEFDVMEADSGNAASRRSSISGRQTAAAWPLNI